jgi:hypothetical protein
MPLGYRLVSENLALTALEKELALSTILSYEQFLGALGLLERHVDSLDSTDKPGSEIISPSCRYKSGDKSHPSHAQEVVLHPSHLPRPAA